jgi:23S rRNA (pseudouridine1915-N3)-methyltransferase
MKVAILAVGALKGGPEKALVDQYAKRITWRLSVTEVKELTPSLLPADSYCVALDERGEALTSDEFSQLIAQQQMIGTKSMTFIIGAADGLPDSVRRKCQKVICLGKMTWPHLLVRGLVMEQLYRAQQILKGHPYHRE